MPPATKRNCSVILFDVNTAPEFQEGARKCLANLCASKWFLESKDSTQLVLLNTQKTNNAISVKFGKCPHVNVASDVTGYDPKLVLPNLEGVETAEADWLVGLAAALEEIKHNYLDGKGIMTTQLVFITDFSTKVKPKQARIQYVIENLTKMKVHLYILGPEVKVPRRMSSFDDIRTWAKNIEFVADEKENPNLSIAKQIVQNTNGIICGLELGQELFKCYTNRWGLQPWKVPLTIGSSVTFATSTTRFLRPVSGPKLKKQMLDGVKPVWKWSLMDDLSKEVAYDDVIGGVFKHNIFVPLPKDVEKDFKYKGLRCFKVVGFTDKRNVPEHIMGGSESCYVQSDGSRSFPILIRVLAEQNLCAIARRVYMANCRPKLVALLPNVQDNVLILVELPYAENVRKSVEEQDIDKAPEIDRSNQAVDAMYEYLQKLDVSDPANRDGNGSVKVPLAPSLMESWRLKLVTRRCLQKYLGNEVDMHDINVELPDFGDAAKYKEFVPPRAVVVSKKRSNNN